MASSFSSSPSKKSLSLDENPKGKVQNEKNEIEIWRQNLEEDEEVIAAPSFNDSGISAAASSGSQDSIVLTTDSKKKKINNHNKRRTEASEGLDVKITR